MTSNRLKLNADKTEFIWLGTSQQLSKVLATPLQVKDQLLQPKYTVLGVLIDSQLTMEAHVRNVVRSCFYQLWQLRSIRRSLPQTPGEPWLLHSIIARRVDYCNVRHSVRRLFTSHLSTSDGSERCCPFGRWCWQIRTHHAGSSRRASLAPTAVLQRIQ